MTDQSGKYARPSPEIIREFNRQIIRETTLMLSPRTLQRYRVNGGGPRYLQFGAAFRYSRADLPEWVLTMRRDGTPEE